MKRTLQSWRRSSWQAQVFGAACLLELIDIIEDCLETLEGITNDVAYLLPLTATWGAWHEHQHECEGQLVS